MRSPFVPAVRPGSHTTDGPAHAAKEHRHDEPHRPGTHPAASTAHDSTPETPEHACTGTTSHPTGFLQPIRYAVMGTTPATAVSAPPVDIDTMRHSISQLIGPDAQSPAGDTLDTLHHLLRGHLQLLIPEVEQAALQRDAEDVPRYCALASVREARARLRLLPAQSGAHSTLAHTRRLARRLAALCDHYETLTGVVMCLACDQPLRDGEDTLPYDHVSASGPVVRVGRIHAQCTHTYRRH